jgi:hypothetical protein
MNKNSWLCTVALQLGGITMRTGPSEYGLT